MHNTVFPSLKTHTRDAQVMSHVIMASDVLTAHRLPLNCAEKSPSHWVGSTASGSFGGRLARSGGGGGAGAVTGGSVSSVDDGSGVLSASTAGAGSGALGASAAGAGSGALGAWGADGAAGA